MGDYGDDDDDGLIVTGFVILGLIVSLELGQAGRLHRRCRVGYVMDITWNLDVKMGKERACVATVHTYARG